MLVANAPVATDIDTPVAPDTPHKADADVPHLTHLPSHVLHQVASHLGRSSALSLARSCRSLQTYGENSAWSDLIISLQRSHLNNPRAYAWAKPFGGERLYKLRHLSRWHTDVDWDEQRMVQPKALAEFVGDLHGMLVRHPTWARSVRSISYDIDRLLSMEFQDLLELVAPTLTALELLPPDFAHGPPPDQFQYFTIEQLFGRFDVPLLALRHLQLTLNEQWEERLRSVLVHTPNLQSLRLTTSTQFSGGWGGRPNLPEAVGKDPWPVLRSLRKLEVDDMDSRFECFLVDLVDSAPLLERVALRDPEFAWEPTKDDDLLDKLGCLPRLSYLAVTSNCARAISKADRFVNLTALSLEEKRGKNLLPQIEAAAIPPMPQIQTLYAYISLYADHIIAWEWTGEWLSLPEPLSPLAPHVLKRLNRASGLTMIQFPGMPCKERRPEDGFGYWGSSQAYKSHDRAVLIRSFRRDQADNRVLYHCRSYSSHHSLVRDMRVFRSENVWEELTDYRGEYVPASVLCKVYDLAGISSAWTEPGRDLELPDEAWEMLEEWWECVQADGAVRQGRAFM